MIVVLVFHPLQCLDSDPKDLVEMIRDQVNPPNYSKERKNSLDNNWMMSDAESVRSANQSRAAGERPLQNTGNFIVPLDKPREQYKISDDPVEKFTILLNYCIADIERFCADVRFIKAKRGKVANGTEEFRATDFIGIFQKFKLAFNLLVRSVKYEKNSCS